MILLLFFDGFGNGKSGFESGLRVVLDSAISFRKAVSTSSPISSGLDFDAACSSPSAGVATGSFGEVSFGSGRIMSIGDAIRSSFSSSSAGSRSPSTMIRTFFLPDGRAGGSISEACTGVRSFILSASFCRFFQVGVKSSLREKFGLTGYFLGDSVGESGSPLLVSESTPGGANMKGELH